MLSRIGRTPRRKSSLCPLQDPDPWCFQNGRNFPGGRVRHFENIISTSMVTNATDFRRWVRTGDEVEFDADGNIYVVDRLKVRDGTLSHRNE